MQIKGTPDVSFPGVVETPPAGGCRLPAQARPVMTRANNSKLPTTTTALDQPEPNQPSKCISNGQDSPSCLWHSKQHQEEARFCCLLGVTFQSLTRLTGISH